MALTGVVSATSAAVQTLYPAKDGTLRDLNLDGIVDLADWTFNESDFEGTVTLNREAPAWEDRVVWEYDLRGVSYEPPVTARLEFRLRGSTLITFPPSSATEVFVYTYPADLVESVADFAAGPAQWEGVATLAARQPATLFILDVSLAVSEAFRSGVDKVGFRFQVNAATPSLRSQSFMDARDADPTTKPALVIKDAVPLDSNADYALDLADLDVFMTCLAGPGVSVKLACGQLDLNLDGRVDLREVHILQRHFGQARQP